jgi:hypothetical protein
VHRVSLLNVWIEPGRALVAVDTAGAMFSASELVARTEASKMLHLPHQNVILAARGETYFFGFVFGAIHHGGLGNDFDELESGIAAALPSLLQQYLLYQGTGGLDRSNMEIELVLVGFSKKRNRMAGCAYELWPGDSAFKATGIDLWRIGPWDAGWPKAPMPNDDLMMRLIARDQVKHMRATHPDCAIGGRLLMAELGPENVTIVPICNLG